MHVMVSVYYGQNGTNLALRIPPSVLISFHEIWHRCSLEDVTVQDTYSDNDTKSDESDVGLSLV